MATVFIIEGKKFNNPLEWPDININANFNKDSTLDSVQPSIEIGDITIVNEARDFLESVLVDKGLFYKVKFSFYIEEDGDTVNAFEGYLENFRFINEERQIVCSPKKERDLNSLNENLSQLTCSLIRDLYNLKNMKFVVEEVDNSEKLAILAISILTYSYILYSQIKDAAFFVGRASEAVGNAAGFSFGTTAALVVEGIAIGAFLFATGAQLVRSFVQLKELLIPTIRETKVVSLKSLLEAPLEYLGYNLNTNLGDLDKNYIWAKGNANRKDYYLPNAQSNLYSPIEVFKLVQDKYEVRYSVTGNTVNCFHVDDPFWFSTSDYILPDNVESNNFEYNLQDNVSSLTIGHETDQRDLWTIEEFEGNEFNVFRNISNIDDSNVKGFQKIIYPIAITSRKEDLSALETAWEGAVSFINTVLQLFGKGKQQSELFSRIGLPRVTSLNFASDHLVYLEGDKIPSNYKDKIGARPDYENYKYATSFVLNPERTKKKLFKKILIDYDLKTFKKNINNGYFKTNRGELGKFTNISYNSDAKCAEIDYWVNEDYPTKLIETYYEPER